MTANTQILWIGNDNLVELQGFRAAADGAYLNGAAVTITLLDAAGEEVAGETWPKPMAYVTGSNGTYRATLASGLTLTEHANYTAVVSANGGSGKVGNWRLDVMARYRRA